MRWRQRETWVFLGDSITQGVHHTHGERSWVEIAHEQIRWVEGRLLDSVINSGMSGWTAADVLPEFDHLVGRFSPTIVSIALGTNDAVTEDGAPRATPEEFSAQLSELVARCEQLGARVVVHTPALLADSARPGRPHLPAYSRAVREVAHRLTVVLVDHEAHWQANFGEQEPVAWLDDPVHPNARGHLEMANLFLRAVGMSYWQDPD